MDITEQRIIQEAKNGNRDAFAELVDLYKDKVYHVSYRMVGNRQEAEDVAQETFLRVYANLDNYDPQYKFSTWIYRIASNLSIDLLRKRKKNLSIDAEISGAEGVDWHDRLADTGKGPEEEVLTDELQEEVQGAIMGLSPKYRAVMLLRYIEDLSLQEISEAVQLPISTIKTRIHRGREALRKKLRFM
ncbi:RNA polymerase sigma factor SigW [Aneurinibacillus aneurinilyticus]|uniref:RNA polymerase sigma factor n=1 Tax=Aneurinibacillus aneurinilyticus TaxID=1391 RepID=A0A848D4V8_ANEAE|nr:RNA polymerase sigma factor SigW [Aneurinibacillus aneurinilyticus]MCI1696771.1 RNA polymerase sigma factor SigW [Aneurinibacillus aneurinilyticus]MED0673826.1 RNA polymerase sigma factor SigW [Aneurinibacillus aneurinilyticus]MED0709464.1 RNA polymerase sigma factor SigW [Aneurinibacillus aneurinilyticus]MED0726123.1 RNA polymerase sigma factor SigW [Aneurinibacillus aneurinilyticus]MED0734575.1 RNA polymerase sigma factor SigW [Aneurinibacillus aneurinilyticus]